MNINNTPVFDQVGDGDEARRRGGEEARRRGGEEARRRGGEEDLIGVEEGCRMWDPEIGCIDLGSHTLSPREVDSDYY